MLTKKALTRRLVTLEKNLQRYEKEAENGETDLHYQGWLEGGIDLAKWILKKR